MHVFEIIITKAGRGLRYKYYVAQRYTCKGKTAGVVTETMPRKRTVDGIYRLAHFGGKRFAAPFVVALGRYRLRIYVLDKLFSRSGSILVENLSILVHQPLEIGSRVGQPTDIVALVSHPAQQIVERRGNLHPFCHKSILSRSFEIEDSHTLVSVCLALQRKVIADSLHKLFKSPWDSIRIRQTIRAFIMGEKSIWSHGSVNFGHHNALRQKSTRHTLTVGHPAIIVAVGVDRSEEWNIVTPEIADSHISQTAVSHIDYSRGRYRVGMTAGNKGLYRCHRIDCFARPFQRHHKTVGNAHLTRKYHPWSGITPSPEFFEI